MTAREFTELLSNNEYKVQVTYAYDLNDGEGVHTETASATKTTLAKTAPTVEVENVESTQTSVSFDVATTDADSILNITKVELYKGDTLVKTADEVTAREFTELLSNNEYKVQVTYAYDLNDGNGAHTETASATKTTVAKTAPSVTVENVESTQTSVSFDVATTDTDSILNITKVELYKGDTLVKTADEVTEREFTELLSNNEYKVQVTYTYDLNDGEGVHTETASATKITVAKTAPTVTMIDFISTQETLGFGIETEDEDDILTIVDVQLYDGETLVATLDKTKTSFEISELQSGTMYTAKVVFTYDLNDGEGEHRQTVTVDHPTLVNSVAVSEMALVNNTQIKLGEELNLRIYFDNPSEINLVNIYVNGIKVQISGGDRKTYAIVKFAPDEAGLVDFYVDKVEYNFNGVLVAQAVDSLAHITFPVFNDLDVHFEGVSASSYEYTGDGIYLTFDNSYDYKVYKINDSSNFIQISDNRFYYYDNNWGNYNDHKIESIEYGYDNYGTTTQAFTYSLGRAYERYVNFYSSIYTAEDFLNMKEYGYYVLMNDLDLRTVSITQTIQFRYLNGNGYTIRGLHNVIDTASQNYYDIFSGRSIFDVKFTELYFSYVNNKSEGISASLLGDVDLYNCTVQGDINTSGVYYRSSIWVDRVGFIEQYNESNTFDLGETIDGVYSQKTQTGKNIAKNENVVTEDGILYYNCGDNARVMLGRFDKANLVDFVIEDDVIAVRNWGNIANERLETIVIGNSVTDSIGNHMFEGCTNLTSVTIGDGVTGIGYYAFYGCINLTDVTIGDGVTSIGEYAFNGCTELTSIVIPDSVTSIGSNAFYGCTNLTSVTIGNGVTSIEAWAFGGCTELTSIVIPDSVTSIGYNVFSGCTRLEAVYITDIAKWCEISFGNYYANPLYYAHSLYLNGELVTDLVIPDGVESIGNHVFKGCTNLTSVTIGNGVTSIGDDAFSGCTNLTDVTIGNGVTGIGNYAFYKCTKLTSIVIPDSVTSIGYDAFTYCDELANVTIGNGVQEIGDWAFAYSYKLTHITISNNVTKIGDYAFQCSGITSIVIGSSVKSIGNDAFNACDSLTSVYYYGTEAEWEQISIDDNNYKLTSATRYYYSQTTPSVAGNYWHYNEDGEIVVW